MSDKGSNEIIGATEFQRIKLMSGIEGEDDGDISSTNPLPVIERLLTKSFTVNGDGAINATLTPTAGLTWRILAIQLHVVGTPSVSENLEIRTKDSVQPRYDTLLVEQDMEALEDFVIQYDGYGMPVKEDRTLDIEWANTEANGWGLTIHYAEDT